MPRHRNGQPGCRWLPPNRGKHVMRYVEGLEITASGEYQPLVQKPAARTCFEGIATRRVVSAVTRPGCRGFRAAPRVTRMTDPLQQSFA